MADCFEFNIISQHTEMVMTGEFLDRRKLCILVGLDSALKITRQQKTTPNFRYQVHPAIEPRPEMWDMTVLP